MRYSKLKSTTSLVVSLAMVTTPIMAQDTGIQSCGDMPEFPCLSVDGALIEDRAAFDAIAQAEALAARQAEIEAALAAEAEAQAAAEAEAAAAAAAAAAEAAADAEAQAAAQAAAVKPNQRRKIFLTVRQMQIQFAAVFQRRNIHRRAGEGLSGAQRF